MFQQIILYCLYKMEGERSISAPFYILQGKQSIQTIQDAKLFHLNRFFTIYKQLNKEDYDAVIAQFVQDGMIQYDGTNYTVTEKTKAEMSEIEAVIHTYHFNGVVFHTVDTIFFERLLLLIQVWTNKSVGKRTYIPIIENRPVEHWVKGVFQKTKNNVDVYLKNLYEELTVLFKKLRAEEASFFVDQLTNAHIIGLSKQQLCEKYRLSKVDVDLMLTHIIHFLLANIEKAHHPLLHMTALHHQQETLQLTQSTMKTYMLWKKGYDLYDIANRRELKINTIYDHIVEIALHEADFPYDDFLSTAEMQAIKQAVADINSFKLKEIKEIVHEEISYFQIRLALTHLA